MSEGCPSIFARVKHLVFIFFVLCLSLTTLAGSGDKGSTATKTVAGKVVDQSGESLAGARITVKETGDVYFADLDGAFTIALKTDREYSLAVETIGYHPKELKSSELSYFSELSLTEL